MDRYKRTEQRLRDIYFEEGYLEYLKRSLEILEYEYGAKGISYDKIGGSTGTSDDTGELAARLADERIRLELQIMRTEHRITYLKDTIGRLTEDEASIIQLYYLKNYPIYKIASELNTSIPTIKRIKGRAMNRLIKGLYGE